MSRLLDDAAIDAFVRDASGWSREGDVLIRTFEATSAREALRLIARIGDLAEGANHHPDLTWVYNRLTIRLSTHDAGGITRRDTRLAACIDDVLDDA